MISSESGLLPHLVKTVKTVRIFTEEGEKK